MSRKVVLVVMVKVMETVLGGGGGFGSGRARGAVMTLLW